MAIQLGVKMVLPISCTIFNAICTSEIRLLRCPYFDDTLSIVILVNGTTLYVILDEREIAWLDGI